MADDPSVNRYTTLYILAAAFRGLFDFLFLG